MELLLLILIVMVGFIIAKISNVASLLSAQLKELKTLNAHSLNLTKAAATVISDTQDAAKSVSDSVPLTADADITSDAESTFSNQQHESSDSAQLITNAEILTAAQETADNSDLQSHLTEQAQNIVQESHVQENSIAESSIQEDKIQENETPANHMSESPVAENAISTSNLSENHVQEEQMETPQTSKPMSLQAEVNLYLQKKNAAKKQHRRLSQEQQLDTNDLSTKAIDDELAALQLTASQEKGNETPQIEKSELVTSQAEKAKQTERSVWQQESAITPPEKSENAFVAWWKYVEQQFASRWMVWIGGAIMALGVIFLVKIGNDHGLFGPKLRIGLAAVLGVAMTAGGELLRRSRFQLNIASGQYIPAALSGAGIIALYASMLGANYIYDMFSLSVLFVILIAISATAMLLAVKQGPFMAALGIVGAYMVPLFISTGSGNVTALLSYIAIVSAGSLVLLSKIYRRWLWWGALIGNYTWLLLSILFISPDGHHIAKQVFLIITTYGFFALPHFGWKLQAFKQNQDAKMVSIARQDGLLTGAVFSLMLMQIVTTIPADITLWLTIWIGCAGLLFIAKRLETLSLVGVIGAFTTLMTLIQSLVPKVVVGTPPDLVSVTFTTNTYLFLGSLICFGSLAILYAVFSYQSAQQHITEKSITSQQKEKSLIWALLSTIVPIITLFVLYCSVPTTWQSTFTDIAFFAAAIVAAVMWYRVVMQNSTNEMFKIIYTIAANIIVAMVLSQIFVQAQLTALLAIQILISAALIKWRNQPVSEWVFKGMMILILFRLSFNPAIFDYTQNLFGIPWTIYGYGIPVLCLWLTMRWLSNQQDYKNTAQLAQINMIYLLGLWINIELRHILHGSYHISLNFNSLTDVSLHALTFGAMALAYIYKAPLSGISFIYKIAAKVFGCFALLLTIIGSLIVYNPLISAQSVGSLPLLNLVTAAYGVPAIMLFILVSYWPEWLNKQYRRYAAILSGLLGMIFITLTVRQLWHGSFLNQPFVEVGEQYFYSFVWMLASIILMTFAIKKQHLVLRRTSLALLGLTIVKLFVWDMSGLTGFYRPISFIGLGLCLVAMGWFYQKFVIQNEQDAISTENNDDSSSIESAENDEQDAVESKQHE